MKILEKEKCQEYNPPSELLPELKEENHVEVFAVQSTLKTDLRSPTDECRVS
ncbi:MAG: hypothetical protein QW672_05170 [Archaeoglobaceae archaeon]